MFGSLIQSALLAWPCNCKTLILPASYRFGHQLRTSLIQNWYFHYIDYDGLKASLKTDYETEPTPENPKPKRKPWSEDDEQRFVKQLESELDKVYTFQKVKAQELIKRIRASEQEVNEVVGKADQVQSGQNVNGDVPSDEDFILLEEDLSDIIADVHDLAKFTQLNYTGFQKIIKKHDVGNLAPARSDGN
jgi:DNA replication licensing factor MCM4